MNELDRDILKIELRSVIANYSTKKAIDLILDLIEKEKYKTKQLILEAITKLALEVA